MMNKLRLILELVAHHGDLSVPSLRNLSLACKQSSPTVQHEISMRRLKFRETYESGEFVEVDYYLNRYGDHIHHGWHRENTLEDDEYDVDEDKDFTLIETRWYDGKRNGIERSVTTVGANSVNYSRDDPTEDYLTSVCNYRNNLMEGEKRFLHYGRIYSLGNFEKGESHGFHRTWHCNMGMHLDFPHQEHSYFEGKLNGPCRVWHRTFPFRTRLDFPSKSQRDKEFRNPMHCKHSCKMGKKHGICTEWHESGQLKSRSEWFEGNLHGTSTEWWASGQLKSRITYRNGQIDGLGVECFESGRVEKIWRECMGMCKGPYLRWVQLESGLYLFQMNLWYDEGERWTTTSANEYEYLSREERREVLV